MARNQLPCFLIGVGIGAACGLLVAPKRGDETRSDLRRGAEEGRDFLVRSSDELRKVASEAIDRGKEAVEDQRLHLESALKAGMEAYRKSAGSHW